MAAKNTRTGKDSEKTVDLPPTGSRNPDPITDAPGSHPIETGIGAIIGGAASGVAVGAVGGPVGALVGAIVGGAVGGGLAGKGVGELIDPTTEDNWLRDYFGSETNKPAGATPDTYRPAYRYGLSSRERFSGQRFDTVETDLRSEWERDHADNSGLGWDHARGAVRHAFDRTVLIPQSDLPREGGADNGGSRGVTIPVQREEVVVNREPRTGQATGVGTSYRMEDVSLPAAPAEPRGRARPMSEMGSEVGRGDDGHACRPTDRLGRNRLHQGPRAEEGLTRTSERFVNAGGVQTPPAVVDNLFFARAKYNRGRVRSQSGGLRVSQSLKRWQAVVLGLTVLAALGIGGFGIARIAARQGLWVDTFELAVGLPEAHDVTPGTPVAASAASMPGRSSPSSTRRATARRRRSRSGSASTPASPTACTPTPRPAFNPPACSGRRSSPSRPARPRPGRSRPAG